MLVPRSGSRYLVSGFSESVLTAYKVLTAKGRQVAFVSGKEVGRLTCRFSQAHARSQPARFSAARKVREESYVSFSDLKSN